MSDEGKGSFEVQANGANSPKLRNDGVGTVKTHGKSGGGESQGGDYPAPHRDKRAKGVIGSFLGHGGQSEIAYHGTGQLGETDVKGQENSNSATSSN